MSDDGGLSRIQQRLNAIPQKLRERMGVVVVEEAEKLAGTMRHFALSSKDTGALIESIEVTPPGHTTPAYSQPGGSTLVEENAAMVTAGNADVRYPHLVEYGTKDAQAQPYFWPAVRAEKRSTQNRIKREIRKVISENWGKK